MRKFRRTPPVPYVPRTPPTGPAGASSARPAEHCGETPPAEMLLATTRLTECVLRPGHSGSHADQDGMRWSHLPPAEDTPAVMYVNVLSHVMPMSHQVYEEKAQLGRILREASERYMGAQPAEAQPVPDGLREQYAEAIRQAAFSCDGDCGKTEQECDAAHPIQAGARHQDVIIYVDGSPEALADAVLAVRDRRMEQLTADLKLVTARACRDSEDLATAQATIARAAGARDWVVLNYPGLKQAHKRLDVALDAPSSPVTTPTTPPEHSGRETCCDACAEKWQREREAADQPKEH